MSICDSLAPHPGARASLECAYKNTHTHMRTHMCMRKCAHTQYLVNSYPLSNYRVIFCYEVALSCNAYFKDMAMAMAMRYRKFKTVEIFFF